MDRKRMALSNTLFIKMFIGNYPRRVYFRKLAYYWRMIYCDRPIFHFSLAHLLRNTPVYTPQRYSRKYTEFYPFTNDMSQETRGCLHLVSSVDGAIIQQFQLFPCRFRYPTNLFALAASPIPLYKRHGCAASLWANQRTCGQKWI